MESSNENSSSTKDIVQAQNSKKDLGKMPKVSKASENAIKGMIESIDDGIYKFWKMVDKNTQARNQNNNNILKKMFVSLFLTKM